MWYFYITRQREEVESQYGRVVDDRQRSDSPDGQKQEPSKSNRDRKKAKAAKRAEAAKRMGKSKTIPPAAFDRMFSSFANVSEDEGFDEIVSVDNREMIKQLAGEESV